MVSSNELIMQLKHLNILFILEIKIKETSKYKTVTQEVKVEMN